MKARRSHVSILHRQTAFALRDNVHRGPRARHEPSVCERCGSAGCAGSREITRRRACRFTPYRAPRAEAVVMVRYEHTQRGTVLQAAFLIGAVVCFAATQLVPAPPFVAPMVLVVFVICAYMFSSLTIQVTDRALHWCFGPGMFRPPACSSGTPSGRGTGPGGRCLS